MKAFPSSGFYFLCEVGDQVNLLTVEVFKVGFEVTAVMNGNTSSPGQRERCQSLLRVRLRLDTADSEQCSGSFSPGPGRGCRRQNWVDPVFGFCLRNVTKGQWVKGSGRRIHMESKPDQEKGKTTEAGKTEKK